MTFAQLVRPGTPVVYGNTIATVSMQSGAPTYGTAETVILGLAVTQLARRYGVPSRTAGMRTGSKACDADAGAQSMIAMLSALLGRVHFVLHAAGFLESGLSASFAKMVIDGDQLSHLLGLVKGLDIDDDALALDVIRDVGPSGHFFGHGHTIQHYDSTFYRPMTAETGTWDQWVEEGRRDVEARAAVVAASLIDSFEPPPSRHRLSTRSNLLRSTKASPKGSTSSSPAAGGSCRTRRSEHGNREPFAGWGKMETFPNSLATVSNRTA